MSINSRQWTVDCCMLDMSTKPCVSARSANCVPLTQILGGARAEVHRDDERRGVGAASCAGLYTNIPDVRRVRAEGRA